MLIEDGRDGAGLSNTLCALTNFEVDLEDKVGKTTSAGRQVVQKAGSTMAEGAALPGVERATGIWWKLV